MNEILPSITAMAELHEQTIIVCTFLAGLSLASMHTIHKQNSGRVANICAVLMYISAIAFITTVCMSALYLFLFRHFNFIHNNLQENLYEVVEFFFFLFFLNLISGVVGIICMLSALGLSGFMNNMKQGIITMVVMFLGLILMVISLIISLTHFAIIYNWQW